MRDTTQRIASIFGTLSGKIVHALEPSPAGDRHSDRTKHRKKRIFIVHPSGVITDHRAHGDGLLAYRYICELAGRGHELWVACEQVDIAGEIPPNVKLYPLQSNARIGLVARLEYGARMRRLFKRLHAAVHFDLAHQLNPVFTGLSLGLAGLRVPLVLGPYVLHWPHLRTSWFKGRALDAICLLQQRLSDAIIVAGPAARTRIVSKRQRDTITHVIPYGIDVAAFPEQPFAGDDPTIVFLAGINERKGIFVLLEAFDCVAARLPRVRLIIAGDGGGRPRAERIAGSSPHAGRIQFVGTLTREEVPRIMAKATVFCSASIAEPYGMNIVEAMASGRAVVATRAGGPVDLIDSRGGILVEPSSPTALADALITVLDTPGLAQRMGAFNRSVARTYDWSVVIDQIEDIYDSVCRPRKGGPGFATASTSPDK